MISIKEFLEKVNFPKKLEASKFYHRVQDDNDGDLKSGVRVFISPDGDVHVRVIGSEGSPFDSSRYRIPIIGGGRSPLVRNALLILAEAIRIENEENPIT